jgi:hypothetical protein
MTDTHLAVFVAATRAIAAGTLVTTPELVSSDDWTLLACTAARVDNVAALVQAVTYASGGQGLDTLALRPHHFFLVRLAEAARARHVLAWLQREAPHLVHQYAGRRKEPLLHAPVL